MRNRHRENEVNSNRDVQLGSRWFQRVCANGVLVGAILAVVAPPSPAQLQFDELRTRYLPAGGSKALVLGDVDGDGDSDLVFTNETDKRNRLFLNDGDGNFTDATTTHMPPDSGFTYSLALSDVDGDGDRDLVIAGSPNRLLLNDGTGAFTDATHGCMPTGFGNCVTMGDVDGDGDDDAIFGNTLDQNDLYLNDGTGTFTLATAVHMPPDNDFTLELVMGDVDADGDPDVIVANLHQNRLYLNDGTGIFADATVDRLPQHTDRTFAVALSDVDGDGDPDLVVANETSSSREGQNRLYLNDGTGTFTDATAARMPSDSDRTVAAIMGDVDRDGDPDVIFGNDRGEQTRLYMNDGTGTFTDATTGRMPSGSEFTNAWALDDVDGDGDPELILGQAGQNQLYANDGTGSFALVTAARMPPVSDTTHAVVLGDVDADGDTDVVFGNGRGTSGEQNRLYLNDGRGTFTDATAARMPTNSDSTSAVALGDVDGDGDPDLVLGDGRGFINLFGAGLGPEQQNRLYLNDGTGTFTDATAARMPADLDYTVAVALEDVDGDGDPDLVLGNDRISFSSQYERGQNRLYLNDGAGFFADATDRMPQIQDHTRAMAIGDVDGDGDPDLVIGNEGTIVAAQVQGGQNRLYLNDGTGTFVDVTPARMPLDSDFTAAVALGDVDGDGDLDLVLGNESTTVNARPLAGQNRLYLNDGNGTFTDATSSRMPVGVGNSVTLGDVDADGDLDMVVADFGPAFVQERNRFYLNDGTGTYTDATVARMPTDGDRTTVVALGDVDSDGDLDLAVGNLGQNRLHLNLLLHIDTPSLVAPGGEYRIDTYAHYGPPRPGDIALVYVSTGTARIPLPPFGTIGLDLSQTAGPAPLFIPQPVGKSSVSFTVPSEARLIGGSVYAQALVLPFAGAWRLTNVVADKIVQ